MGQPANSNQDHDIPGPQRNDTMNQFVNGLAAIGQDQVLQGQINNQLTGVRRDPQPTTASDLSLVADLTPGVNVLKATVQSIVGVDLFTQKEVSRVGNAAMAGLGLIPAGGFTRAAGGLARAETAALRGAAEGTVESLNGLNFYKMADSRQAMQYIRDLTYYYRANGGPGISMLTMDTKGMIGGELNTINGSISLNMSVPLEFRAGFRAEELLHFQQLNERGLIGTMLTPAPRLELATEAAQKLLNNGFRAH